MEIGRFEIADAVLEMRAAGWVCEVEICVAHVLRGNVIGRRGSNHWGCASKEFSARHWPPVRSFCGSRVAFCTKGEHMSLSHKMLAK